MAYRIGLDNNLNAVYLKHYNGYSIEEFTEARSEAAKLLKEKKLKFLITDISELKIVSPLIDLFHFYTKHNEILPKNTHILVIISEDSMDPDCIKFIENITINRCIALSFFNSYDEAVKIIAEIKDN